MSIITLENGAQYDTEKGRIVANPGGGKYAITSDNARDMVRLREEKRMRLYNEGAKRAVQDTRLLAEFGEDAHLVERAMTLQQIATTPDAGKAAVMADTALQRAQGYETPRDKTPQQGQADDPVRALGVLALEYLRRRVDADAE